MSNLSWDNLKTDQCDGRPPRNTLSENYQEYSLLDYVDLLSNNSEGCFWMLCELWTVKGGGWVAAAQISSKEENQYVMMNIHETVCCVK